MKDGILELWLRLVALHIEDPTEENAVVREIRDQWLLASRGYFNGCVPDGMNAAVSTDEGKEKVIGAIIELVSALKRAPKVLDNSVLNVMGMSGTFESGFETFRLIEVSEAMLQLINGEVGTSDASDTSFMPGCK